MGWICRPGECEAISTQAEVPKELRTISRQSYTTHQGIAAMLIVICYLVVIVNVRFVYCQCMSVLWSHQTGVHACGDVSSRWGSLIRLLLPHHFLCVLDHLLTLHSLTDSAVDFLLLIECSLEWSHGMHIEIKSTCYQATARPQALFVAACYTPIKSWPSLPRLVKHR